MTRRTMKMLPADENGAYAVALTRNNVAMLYFTLITSAGLTRNEVAERLVPTTTPAAVTTWVHGVRSFSIGRLHETAAMCGFVVKVMVKVPGDAAPSELDTRPMERLSMHDFTESLEKYGWAATVVALPAAVSA